MTTGAPPHVLNHMIRPSDRSLTTHPSHDLCLAYQLMSSLFGYPAVPFYNRPGLHSSTQTRNPPLITSPTVAQLVHIIFDTYFNRFPQARYFEISFLASTPRRPTDLAADRSCVRRLIKLSSAVPQARARATPVLPSSRRPLRHSPTAPARIARSPSPPSAWLTRVELETRGWSQCTFALHLAAAHLVVSLKQRCCPSQHRLIPSLAAPRHPLDRGRRTSSSTSSTGENDLCASRWLPACSTAHHQSQHLRRFQHWDCRSQHPRPARHLVINGARGLAVAVEASPAPFAALTVVGCSMACSRSQPPRRLAAPPLPGSSIASQLPLLQVAAPAADDSSTPSRSQHTAPPVPAPRVAGRSTQRFRFQHPESLVPANVATHGRCRRSFSAEWLQLLR